METTLVSVTLCLGSQSFQKNLASTLMQRGMLRRVISFGAEIHILDPDGAGGLKPIHRYSHYKIVNRLLWGGWRRVPGNWYSPQLPIAASAAYADWLASRWVSSSNLFHGWAGLSLACLRAAKGQGSVTMLENPTMHPREWQKTVLEECDAFGIRPRDCRAILPSPLIRRMEKEYELCNFIIVPSSVARESFEQSGYPGKAIVVNAGVDHHFFTPPSTPETQNLFRVCYTGRVELAKGVVYLLQAWKQLGLRHAELVLVGEVAPEINSLVKQYEHSSVRFTGYLPPDQVAAWYQVSNLFAFPSVNEGLARVILEAMASGLPIVATHRSGADDCVTPGLDGTIVASRDVGALAEAILWHFQNREESAVMGRAARTTIEQRFTLSHYEDRMINVYCSSGLE